MRSDTIAQPTEEMREARRNAVVGDDYYREDPTVAELEKFAAAKLGRETGLFVVSGTMGNLVSILTHTQRGDVIILEADVHVYRCETAHLTSVAGVMPKRVKGNRGILDPADVEEVIFAEGVLYPGTPLICVENTHNAADGTCVTPEQMSALRKGADSNGLATHVDGARIFSAAVASSTIFTAVLGIPIILSTPAMRAIPSMGIPTDPNTMDNMMSPAPGTPAVPMEASNAVTPMIT